MTASQKRIPEPGSSKDDESGTLVTSSWLSRCGHKTGAQLLASGSHMIGMGASPHTCLLSERKVFLRRPPADVPQAPSAGLSHITCLGSPEAERAGVQHCRTRVGRALPRKRMGSGAGSGHEACLLGQGDRHFLYSHNWASGWAFCFYTTWPQTRVLFDFLSLLLCIIPSPSFGSDW